MTQIYDRQQLLKGLKIPATASIAGCGGTGFWTGIFLAMSGCENLILIDPDKIEESNLNRLLLGKNDIGIPKVVAVSTSIVRIIRPDCRIECHELKLETPDDCQVLRGTVFCCTDNVKSQQIIHKYCNQNNLPYQRVGYDGTILNVSRAFPFSLNNIDDILDGYAVTPSWVVPAVQAACAAVFSQCMSEITLTDDMSKLNTDKGDYERLEKLYDDEVFALRKDIADQQALIVQLTKAREKK